MSIVFFYHLRMCLWSDFPFFSKQKLNSLATWRQSSTVYNSKLKVLRCSFPDATQLYVFPYMVIFFSLLTNCLWGNRNASYKSASWLVRGWHLYVSVLTTWNFSRYQTWSIQSLRVTRMENSKAFIHSQ